MSTAIAGAAVFLAGCVSEKPKPQLVHKPGDPPGQLTLARDSNAPTKQYLDLGAAHAAMSIGPADIPQPPGYPQTPELGINITPATKDSDATPTGGNP